MDGVLSEFLEESGVSAGLAANGVTQGRCAKRKKFGVEGVWVGCRGASASASVEDLRDEVAEEDEMIWWSWDGKIIGFSDW
jgi:hypothetical protein